MTQRSVLTGAGLVIAAVLFFAVNIASNAALTSARLDLTEHDLYTLSPGTRNILRTLEEPVTLRLYLSTRLAPLLPGISGYATRVRELLEEFAHAGEGNVRLEVIDPEPFSEAEDRAVGYGLQGVPVGEGETTFYFGLVGTNAIGQEQTIPFFQPDREEFLEYDLAKLVHRLAHPEPPVIGLLSSLPLAGSAASPFSPGDGGQPWLIYEQLQQSFDVRTLPAELTAVPDEVDVLMVVHPKDLPAGTRYAIDQFVLAGGRALVFVDPLAEADQPGRSPFNRQAPNAGPGSNLPELFDAWGVELLPGQVIGDLPFARRVQFRRQSRLDVANYPVWIELPSSQFNQEDIVTADLQSLTLATPGALVSLEARKPDVTPLVRTDDQAMTIDAGQLQLDPDITQLLRDYRPSGETYSLAARITGRVRSAFPDGPPAEAGAAGAAGSSGGASPRVHLPESRDPINVIVVADTDLLQDYFWVQVQRFLGQRIGIPTAGNGAFVVNALDNLTGSNDLISVRTRGGYKRPFTLVKSLQQQAEQRFREAERMLLERKRATERKIRELQAQKQDASALILSPEQERELERFREELVQIRKELRRVQRELHRDIDRLDSWLKFLNIGLVPLLIGGAGLVLSLRSRRRRPQHGQPSS